MNKNLIRNKCVICSSKLKHILTLKNYPVYMGASSDQNFLLENQTWCGCENCGCIQLKKLLPLKLVYKKFHHEIVGNVWEKHHEDFKNFLLKYSSPIILEIGGSDGYLASKALKSHKIKQWNIVEPNIPKKRKKNKKLKFINSYIEKIDIKKFKNFTFVHSHTIEHFYNPKNILKKISNLQNIGDKMIFSVPNLDKYLKQKFINTIDFEHTYLLTESILDIFLYNHHYKIIKKKYFYNHSIFYCVERKSKSKNTKYLKNFKKNKFNFLNFSKYYQNKVFNINKRLKKIKTKCFLFGASQFSQFLLYRGLNQSKIISILDNSKTKNNKYVYGYKFKIKNPKIIKKIQNPHVILIAGNYQTEITHQLKAINSSTKIIR